MGGTTVVNGRDYCSNKQTFVIDAGFPVGEKRTK